ncbi:kinase-like protein [Cucurbitaria berberidis CBS 394.84]|uniref:Kinase-like protein n=1 Tax=Cucurbitaria berberidis CBS 394.84 TaxID=1168544 RepID=A0A9P4L8Q4_9PLEO|nr:kinase-like protein [Cucurbitaria berberidis CBS 394.84]KAF1846305.1 kinase-like protein [Cucurbitaria berberidis CBS 394.84]
MLWRKFSPAFCYHHRVAVRDSQLAQSKVRFPCVYLAPRRVNNNSCFHPQFSTTSLRSTIEYRWIDGVERLDLYDFCGYHPVMIDSVLHNRYRIVDKLGFGGYSTIWLARDETVKRYVAVKIGISGLSLPRREPDILRTLSGSGPQAPRAASDANRCPVVPRIFDVFDVHGPNGTHTCYTFTPAQGSLKEASFSRLFPIQVARALAAKLATAVSFVHSRGFVHGDLHLRNVLVKLPSTFDELSVQEFREKFGEPDTVPITRVDEKPLTSNVPAQAVVPLYLGKKAQDFILADAHGLILSDFGEAFSPATEQRLGRDCNIPLAKRAPEALFDPNEPLSYPSDIWSLGTAIWEILGMKFIFSESETQDEIVAQQIDVLGSHNFPKNWGEQWERLSEEGNDGNDAIPRQPVGDRETWPSLEDAFEEFVQKYRRKREAAGTFEDEETRAILHLIRGMLKFQPEERLTIEEVLRSEWMVKWALPELK